MFLNRTSPISSFGHLSRNLDRMFDEVFGTAGATVCRPSGCPALNVWEDDNAYTVEAETPGLTMEDLTVEVLGSDLSISGERKDGDTADAKFHRRERRTGAFRRTLSLPDDVDPNGVEATLKNGILTVRLPKAEAARARRIEVKANA